MNICYPTSVLTTKLRTILDEMDLIGGGGGGGWGVWMWHGQLFNPLGSPVS